MESVKSDMGKNLKQIFDSNACNCSKGRQRPKSENYRKHFFLHLLVLQERESAREREREREKVNKICTQMAYSATAILYMNSFMWNSVHDTF
jgi:hypothetical protein